MHLSGAPPPCRELIRRARTRPLADKLIDFIRDQSPRHSPGGDLGKALAYTLNQWDKFAVCLEDGSLQLDTNLVENLIRPAKLGMKNWMFFGSLEAGKNNAALAYTLLANCRLQGLDPEDYLVEMLRRLPAPPPPSRQRHARTGRGPDPGGHRRRAALPRRGQRRPGRLTVAPPSRPPRAKGSDLGRLLFLDRAVRCFPIDMA